jgi:nucleotide-binding universal stress UspA family protein
LPIRTILHPTDFSERARYAFPLACTLARDHGAQLLVVHVARRPVIVAVDGRGPPDPEHYQEELTAKLHTFRARNSTVRVRHLLALGADPAAEILRGARENKCDLIVMGTHGSTGLGRLLMGSVAEQVVRRALCPVLTVKTPFPAETDAGEAVPGVSREELNAG